MLFVYQKLFPAFIFLRAPSYTRFFYTKVLRPLLPKNTSFLFYTYLGTPGVFLYFRGLYSIFFPGRLYARRSLLFRHLFGVLGPFLYLLRLFG